MKALGHGKMHDKMGRIVRLSANKVWEKLGGVENKMHHIGHKSTVPHLSLLDPLPPYSKAHILSERQSEVATTLISTLGA